MFSPSLTTPTAEASPPRHAKQAGNRWIAGLLFLTLCLGLSGCSLVPRGYLAQPEGRPARALVENVPFFPQEELQCGPAALAMALTWSGVPVTPADLSAEVFTPGLKGSLQNALIGAARRHGRVAYPIAGIDALMTEIAAGQPVIVLVNLGFFWYPRWHYAVVIGYDQPEKEIILHSGVTAEEALSFWTFNNLWKRSDSWGLLVLPPERLPAVAEETPWLTAVAGLEKAGQWQAAATGYETALKRWDTSFIAWMGLGNSAFSLHRLDTAADAFRRATELEPQNGIAYNNWATVLDAQGKREEALKAAQRAVELGGPFQDAFRQTLEEIEKKGSNTE